MNMLPGEGHHLECLIEAYQNGNRCTFEEIHVPPFARSIRLGEALTLRDLTTYHGVGKANCYGFYMMNNTGSAPVFDTEITKKNAQRISKMFHVFFGDRGPYLFQDENVDDKIIRGSLNEMVRSTSVVGSFTWGLTSTITSSEDRTHRSIGARVYVRMSNRGMDNTDFPRALMASQMEYSRNWRR